MQGSQRLSKSEVFQRVCKRRVITKRNAEVTLQYLTQSFTKHINTKRRGNPYLTMQGYTDIQGRRDIPKPINARLHGLQGRRDKTYQCKVTWVIGTQR